MNVFVLAYFEDICYRNVGLPLNVVKRHAVHLVLKLHMKNCFTEVGTYFTNQAA